jgi:hypothetical protein
MSVTLLGISAYSAAINTNTVQNYDIGFPVVPAGTRIVVWVKWVANSSGAGPTVTDTQGNTYAQLFEQRSNVVHTGLAAYVAIAAGPLTGSDHVRVTWPSGYSTIAQQVLCYSGAGGAAGPTSAAYAEFVSGSPMPFDSGSVTVAGAEVLLLGCLYSGYGSSAAASVAASGWTIIDDPATFGVVDGVSPDGTFFLLARTVAAGSYAFAGNITSTGIGFTTWTAAVISLGVSAVTPPPDPDPNGAGGHVDDSDPGGGNHHSTPGIPSIDCVCVDPAALIDLPPVPAGALDSFANAAAVDILVISGAAPDSAPAPAAALDTVPVGVLPCDCPDGAA